MPRWSSGRYRSISGMCETLRESIRERDSDCIAPRETYRSGCGGQRAPGRVHLRWCGGGAGGGARLGWAVPTGAFHGFDGVAAAALARRMPADGFLRA